MEFRLLGPIEVVVNDEPIGITAPRQEILLAMLLLEANRVVSVETLVDALWDEEPPSTARSQVQISVSALRRLLARPDGAEVIVTRPPGYLIRVADDAFDLKRFERLVASGMTASAEQRTAEAVTRLRDALGLWRGPAAAGVESRLVQVAATRLNERRLAVLEDCLELELQLGRHRDLIGELGELVAQHPLHERFRAQLMLALHRSGRQPEALEIYRDGREMLLEQLGLDPGEGLRSIERAILANDPSIASPEGGLALVGKATVTVPRQLPKAPADFTGREELLEQVCSLLSPGADSTGGVPVAMLTGRGGVGKTALALQAAHLLQTSFPDGQLFAQLGMREGQPTAAAGVLEQFLRSLGLGSSSLPRSEEDRAAMYRSLLADRRLLVVLDDAVSSSQVAPLLPGNPGCPVIVTTQKRLPGLEGVRRFEIDVLDERSSVDLLARMIGPERARAEPGAIRALVGFCERLPLALRIAAARLCARPHWRVGQMVRRLEDEKRRLDELDVDGVTIRATLAFSYEGLDSSGQRLLRRLGLLGAVDFASWIGAPLLDAEVDVAEELLENLVEASLVEARVAEDGPARFQLHNLVRIYAVDRLAAEESAADRSATIRRTLACFLSLATAARRRAYGGDFSILHGSSEHWPLPDQTVDDLLSDPIRWFQSEHATLVAAIFHAARAGLDELCWDLAMTSVTLFQSGSYRDDWRATHEAALAAVRNSGNHRGEAALLYSLGIMAVTGQPEAAARSLQRSHQLFEQLGDTHGRALTLSGMAFANRLAGRYDRALSQNRKALAAFQQVDDLIGVADSLRGMAQIEIDRRHFDAGEKLLMDALALSQKAGAPRAVAQTEYILAELALRMGRLQQAEDAFESARMTTLASGDTIGHAYSLVGRGATRTKLAQFARAEADLRAAHDASDDCSDPLLRGRTLLALAELDIARDRAVPAMAWLDNALGVLGEIGSAGLWRSRALLLMGNLHARAGRPTEAEQAWRTALELAHGEDPVLCGELADAIDSLNE